jgi:hypothetical protein
MEGYTTKYIAHLQGAIRFLQVLVWTIHKHHHLLLVCCITINMFILLLVWWRHRLHHLLLVCCININRFFLLLVWRRHRFHVLPLPLPRPFANLHTKKINPHINPLKEKVIKIVCIPKNQKGNNNPYHI